MVVIGATISPRCRAKSSTVRKEPRPRRSRPCPAPRRLRKNPWALRCDGAQRLARRAASTTSPSAGARPWQIMAAAPRSARSFATCCDQSQAMREATGNPSSAWWMAGASARSRPDRPCASSIAAQASSAPGNGHGMDRTQVRSCPRAAPQWRHASRTAGAVIAPDRLSRLCHHAEAVAADTGHVRLDDAEHRHGGYRGVGCIAPVPQRIECGKARQRMRGRGHAVAGDDRRAPGQLKVAAHLIPAVADANSPAW